MPQSAIVPLTNSAGSGATVENQYHAATAQIVPVNVEDLREFKKSSQEEFWQFTLAQFFAGGAFWVIVERVFTVSSLRNDVLVWICAIIFICACIVGYFGYAQLSRRRSRIDKYIELALKPPPGATAGTAGFTQSLETHNR